MFSVVIPLYNKELSIFKTIESVLNQDFVDFEIIVVNDGSTDNSIDIVKSINDERVFIYSKENGGVSSARNFGIQKSKFEWIAFLDGDDFWEINHLSVMWKLINKYKKNKVFCSSFVLSDELKIYISRDEEIVIDSFFKGYRKYGYFVNSSNIVVNKDVFNYVLMFKTELSIGEDVELWIRLIKEFSIVKSFIITSKYNRFAENRALSKITPIKNNFGFYFNLNKDLTADEKYFYINYLRSSLKSFLYKRDYLSFLILVLKYNIKIFSK